MNKFLNSEDISEIVNELGKDINILNGKRILLTGGRGFLGRYFIEVFNLISQNLEKSLELVVLDNLVSGCDLKDKISCYKNMKFFNHNVIEPFKYEDKFDYVIHAAGIASPYYYKKMPLQTLDVAIIGTRNMLDVALENKSRFSFFSSSEIYGDPDSRFIPIKEDYRGNVACQGPRACYDESKRVGETLSDIYFNYKGLSTNTIRPFNIYGPGMQENDYRVLPNFARNIKKNNSLNVYGSGKQTRTFCYVTDAIIGFLLVILKGKPGHAYNIGNSFPEISILDLVKEIKNITGSDVSYEIVNYPSTYPADEPTRRLPDLSKAKDHLNYEPKISLSEGLKRFLNWSDTNYIG